jgi:hypothetical protein
MMIKALRKFGIIATGRLVRCSKLKLEKDALLHTNKVKNDSHWAVWDARQQKILDPYYKRTRPHSCLLILRRNKTAAKRRGGLHA